MTPIRYNIIIKRKGNKKMTHIKNLPDYAYNYDFIVVRVCDDDFWFWGAYDTFDKAQKVADDIDGIVVIKMDRG